MIRTGRLVILMGALALGACTKQRKEEARNDLAEAGYEVSQPAFFRAAESDDLTALGKMLSIGVALDTSDPAGRTVLHAAAGAGALQSVELLLERGMEIDARDAAGRTPLMEAVVRSTPETVGYLLRHGADPLLKDHESYKPLMLAVKEDRPGVVAELAPYVREDLDDALLAAAILGRTRAIDELTNFGASVYTRLDDGRTALMLAAQNGHDDAVDLLLAIGANRFAMDDEGRLAADFARLKGYDDLADRLAAEPQDGDFELEEPAELGAAMAVAMAGEAEAPGDADAGEPGEDEPAGPAVEDLQGVTLGAPAPAADRNGHGALASADGDEVAGGRLTGDEAPVVDVRPVSGEPPVSTGIRPDSPEPEVLVMRGYRQTELPLRLDGVEDGVARVKVAGTVSVALTEGEVLPGSVLKVVRVEQRMTSGKAGGAVETSVVEVEDTRTGARRELTTGLPALAHDPVALVEDTATGRLYVARSGQEFTDAEGREWRVDDVRPTQVVLEKLGSGETMTIALRGPRG